METGSDSYRSPEATFFFLHRNTGCVCTTESALNTAGVPSGLHFPYF